MGIRVGNGIEPFYVGMYVYTCSHVHAHRCSNNIVHNFYFKHVSLFNTTLNADSVLYILLHMYLAKLLENAESDTDEPHMGSIPLQRVLAFWRVALSHSSRDRASLSRRERGRVTMEGVEMKMDGV